MDDNSWGLTEFLELALASGATALGSVKQPVPSQVKLNHYYVSTMK
jgi:hypothetical protein